MAILNLNEVQYVLEMFQVDWEQARPIKTFKSSNFNLGLT